MPRGRQKGLTATQKKKKKSIYKIYKYTVGHMKRLDKVRQGQVKPVKRSDAVRKGNWRSGEVRGSQARSDEVS